jgi:hypothetical protein
MLSVASDNQQLSGSAGFEKRIGSGSSDDTRFDEDGRLTGPGVSQCLASTAARPLSISNSSSQGGTIRWSPPETGGFYACTVGEIDRTALLGDRSIADTDDHQSRAWRVLSGRSCDLVE